MELLDLWWALIVAGVVARVAARYAPVVERALELRMAKWVMKYDPTKVDAALKWCSRQEREDSSPEDDSPDDEPPPGLPTGPDPQQ